MVAQLSHEQVVQILDRRGLPACTENTITDREELFSELSEIRERGYAIDDQENIEVLCCIAAPVTSENGGVGAVRHYQVLLTQ